MSWTLEQREDVAATRFEVRFPDAVQFFNAWLDYNPLAPGTIVRLYVNDDLIFTGVIHGHSFRFSGADRSVTFVAHDRMGTLKDACVELKMDRERIHTHLFHMTVNGDDGNLFEAITADATPLYLRPWHPNFLVQVWWADGVNPRERIALSEYEVLYETGAIYFRYDSIKSIGRDVDDLLLLTDIEDEIYASFVYFDADDSSTTISNVIRAMLEHPAANGGLGWTDGVEYAITDETPADILSGIRWSTDEGDGDAVSFLQNLYDNPRIGLAPSYWIRDFNGNGQVEAKLVAQDNDAAIDVDLIMDASFPSPLQNIYTRAVLVNNEATRHCISSHKNEVGASCVLVDKFDSSGWNVTCETPLMLNPEAPGTLPVPAEGRIGYLRDDTCQSSWGYFRLGLFDWDAGLPQDMYLFRATFDKVRRVDTIHINCRWTFGKSGLAEFVGSQGDLSNCFGTVPNSCVNGIKAIHDNQRFTVEYNTDEGAGEPDADKWHPLHPDLYFAEVNPLSGRDSWLTVTNINIETRHLRVVINNPMFFKIGESDAPYANANRAMLWWMSEFQVYERGRVKAGDSEDQPSVQFTDDAGAGDRCMCDMADNQVDMYRPELLAIAEAMGLKYRTLVVESDDLWDFRNKDDELMATPDDCDLVSLGYKYLVTRLNASSKENEWQVRIDPRPDIRIGDTVYSSKINAAIKYLVHGSVLQMASERLNHSLTLSDHETSSGGEGEGYCA